MGDRLAGRVAIVTGASRGMGKGIAKLFGAEGAAVAVVARTTTQWSELLPGTIHETVAEIEAEGGRAVAISADLAKEADIERLVDEARDALGPIDILINNAALTVPGRPPSASSAPSAGSAPKPAPARTSPLGPGSFLDFPLKGFRLHYDIGLFASYRLMQLTIPDMLATGRGAIVNISSLAAFLPGAGPYETSGRPAPFAYGGNKAALHHLTQSVAYEVAPHGIAVNVLSPSEPILTPGNLVAAKGETDFASPEDFAEATLRLCLVEATDVTGQILWSEDVLHPELGQRGWLRPL